MKIANKNKIILYFFVFVFGFFTIYHLVTNMSYKRSIIEGVTSENINTKNNNNVESNADKEIKTAIKNMNKYLSTNVEPKINKLLEKIKNTTDEINGGIMQKSKDDINNFSKKNKEATKVSSQKEVPPFPDNDIKNLV
jgi:hypothetical protein